MWCKRMIPKFTQRYYSQLGGAKKQPKHHQKATALITHIPLSKTNRHTDKQAKKQANQQTNQMVFLPASQFPSHPNQRHSLPQRIVARPFYWPRDRWNPRTCRELDEQMFLGYPQETDFYRFPWFYPRENQNGCKCMVIFRDFPDLIIVHRLGRSIFHDPLKVGMEW